MSRSTGEFYGGELRDKAELKPGKFNFSLTKYYQSSLFTRLINVNQNINQALN